MDLEILAARLKSARKLRKKTLEEVAAAVGLNKSTIQRYETCKIANPKMPILRAMADYLSVNPQWLAGEDDQMEPYDTTSERERYLYLLETRPEIRALLKSVDDASPSDIKAVMDFFTALRGHG